MLKTLLFCCGIGTLFIKDALLMFQANEQHRLTDDLPLSVL